MREKFADSRRLSITLSYLSTESYLLRHEHVYDSADRLQLKRYCSIRSWVINGYSAVLSTANQLILLYTAHRIFNRFYSILSTDYSMHIVQYSTENSMDITQYYPPQWKLHNSPEFNGYCSILFTEYSMDFAQYSPQTTELIAQ